MSNQTFDQNLNNLIGVREISDEAATSISGGYGNDATMAQITRNLERLNLRMAQQQIRNSKKRQVSNKMP